MNETVFSKVFRAWGSFLLILLLLSVFCGDVASQTTSPKKTQPLYGGTLRIITRSTPVNLGVSWVPYHPDDQTLSHPAVETLLSLDDQGNVIPWLATGWKISKDLKSITLTLRKKVKFHDGTDFNAEAVKYLIDQYRTLGGPELKLISSVDIIDSSTVKLNLVRFENSLLNSFTTRPGDIISPTALKAHDKTWAMMNPVGTGPFKFVKYERDSFLRYEKFKDYWQKGKPYLDAVEFHFITDPLTSTMAFQKGEGDLLMRVQPKDVLDLRATGKYAFDVSYTSNAGLTGDGDNPKSPFSDVRVRKAIDYAIDKEKISKEIFYGINPPAEGPVAKVNEAYDPKLKGYPYDPKKAKALLAEAGYPNGFKTKIIYENIDNQFLYVAIQAYLKDVGIDTTLEPVSVSQYAQIRSTGWENAMIKQYFITGKGFRAAQTFFNMFSRKAPRFPSMYHSDILEAKATKAIAEPDPKKSKLLAQDLVRTMHEQAVYTPVYTSVNVHARTNNVHDTTFGLRGPTRWAPADAWLSK